MHTLPEQLAQDALSNCNLRTLTEVNRPISVLRTLYLIEKFKYFQNIIFHSSLINYTSFLKIGSSLAILVSSTDLA